MPWLAAATLPGLLVLVLTVGGRPATTGDSVQYANAAASLAATGRLTTGINERLQDQFDERRQVIAEHPLVLWPPGYSLLIAATMRVSGLTALPAAAIVNAISYAIFIAGVAVLLRRAIDATSALAITWIVSVTPAVQSVFRFALSDGAFLAAVALLALCLSSLVNGSSGRLRASWLAALSIAAAMHLRYTGVLLIPLHAAAVIAVIGAHADVRRRAALYVASIAAGIAGGTIFLWHRLITLGCLSCATRPSSSLTPAENFRDAAAAMIQSLPLIYGAVPGPIDAIVSAAIVIALWAMAARVAPEPLSKAARVIAAGGLLLGAIYGAGLVTLRATVEFNALDPRLLAPAILPLLALTLGAAVRRLAAPWRLWFGAAVAALLVAGAAVGLARTPWRVSNEAALAETPAMQFIARIRREQPGVLVFTPDAYAARVAIAVDAPFFPLPANGLPVLRPGEHAIVVLRGDDAAARAVYGERLAREATVLVEGSGVSAWRLPDR